ncbi:MAG: hypothetical protein RLZZ387_1276 [Chloroflexota bacterium]|jgi:Ca2+-binding RTX toxin-like protein
MRRTARPWTARLLLVAAAAIVLTAAVVGLTAPASIGTPRAGATTLSISAQRLAIAADCPSASYSGGVVNVGGTVSLGRSNALIFGSGGSDTITVTGDNNCLVGGDGDDTLTVSGSGNTIVGGGGTDTCTGGSTSGCP